MRKRVMFGSAVVLLSILASLVVWQGSFNLGTFAPAPSDIQQTYLFWAVSTLIFILTVTLGFMLFRTVVKLYIERHSNRPGSHIKSKLIGGALALSVLPIYLSGAVERLGPESESGQMVQPSGPDHEYRSGADRQRAESGGGR